MITIVQEPRVTHPYQFYYYTYHWSYIKPFFFTYFRFQTGEIKETIQVSDQAISADLVLAKKEYVLLGTLSGVCASIHTGTNSVAWRGTLGSPVFASPVLYDSDKYVIFAEVNGEIHCRTVEKGIKVNNRGVDVGLQQISANAEPEEALASCAFDRIHLYP